MESKLFDRVKSRWEDKKWRLQPARNKPDFTEPGATDLLRKLLKARDFNLLVSGDTDKILYGYQDLTVDQKELFRDWFKGIEHELELTVHSIELEGGSFNIRVFIDLVKLSDDTLEKKMGYNYVGLDFDLQTRVVTVKGLYSVTAYLKGYSTGRIILNEIETIARKFRSTKVIISNPVPEVEGFYKVCGYDTVGAHVEKDIA